MIGSTEHYYETGFICHFQLELIQVCSFQLSPSVCALCGTGVWPRPYLRNGLEMDLNYSFIYLFYFILFGLAPLWQLHRSVSLWGMSNQIKKDFMISKMLITCNRNIWGIKIILIWHFFFSSVLSFLIVKHQNTWL